MDGLPQCGGHGELGQDPGSLTSHVATECPITSQEKGCSRQNHPLYWKVLIWNQNLFPCILEAGQSPTQMQAIPLWLLPPQLLFDLEAYRRHEDVPQVSLQEKHAVECEWLIPSTWQLLQGPQLRNQRSPLELLPDQWPSITVAQGPVHSFPVLTPLMGKLCSSTLPGLPDT